MSIESENLEGSTTPGRCRRTHLVKTDRSADRSERHTNDSSSLNLPPPPSLAPPPPRPPAPQDNDGNVSEADTAEIEDGAGDVAAGDVTAGLDDSISGGNGQGGGGGGEGDGGRYDNDGGGDGDGVADDENMLDITGPMEPAAMVPQVRQYERAEA